MFDVVELINEMFFLDKNIQEMRRVQNATDLWSIYAIAQKRLERIMDQNLERINIIDSVIQESEWGDMIKEVEE